MWPVSEEAAQTTYQRLQLCSSDRQRARLGPRAIVCQPESSGNHKSSDSTCALIRHPCWLLHRPITASVRRPSRGCQAEPTHKELGFRESKCIAPGHTVCRRPNWTSPPCVLWASTSGLAPSPQAPAPEDSLAGWRTRPSAVPVPAHYVVHVKHLPPPSASLHSCLHELPPVRHQHSCQKPLLSPHDLQAKVHPARLRDLPALASAWLSIPTPH